MTELAQTIVIDNGSGMIKAGYAGEKAPREVFPTIVGRLNRGMQHYWQMSEHIGDEAKV